MWRCRLRTQSHLRSGMKRVQLWERSVVVVLWESTSIEGGQHHVLGSVEHLLLSHWRRIYRGGVISWQSIRLRIAMERGL